MSNKINKLKNKEIRRIAKLKQEMLENPDWCFCEELFGLESDVDWKNDEPIGKTEPIDGFPFPHSKRYSQEIYLCKRRGKEYIIV
jgi:hypothetical protein